MIDLDDDSPQGRNQMLRLALSGVYMGILVARGVKTTTDEAALVSVACADALINAVAAPPVT